MPPGLSAKVGPTQLPTLPAIQGCFLTQSSPTVLTPMRREKRERIKAHKRTVPQLYVHWLLSFNCVQGQLSWTLSVVTQEAPAPLTPHPSTWISKTDWSSQCLSRYCKVITLSDLIKQTNSLPQDVVKGEKTLVSPTCLWWSGTCLCSMFHSLSSFRRRHGNALCYLLQID